MKYHDCKPIQLSENFEMLEKGQNNDISNKLIEPVLNLLQNAPENKQMIVNINNNITYNNNKVNSNNKIIKKTTNNLQFLETNPDWIRYGYDIVNPEKYIIHNEQFDEKITDAYLYEESLFKDQYKEAIVLYEKKSLELEGFKMLHNEILKDPKYQNVRIKKTKLGKCFIFDIGSWKETSLRTTITNVCAIVYMIETQVSMIF